MQPHPRANAAHNAGAASSGTMRNANGSSSAVANGYHEDHPAGPILPPGAHAAPLIARGPLPPSLQFGQSRIHDRPQSSVYGPSTSQGFGFKTSFDSSYSGRSPLPNALGISPTSAKGAAGADGSWSGGSGRTSALGSEVGGIGRKGSVASLENGVSPGSGSSPSSSRAGGGGSAIRSPDGRVLFLSTPSPSSRSRFSSSSSTGFMMPISGTGARQKVSIVNPGQRKKAAMAAANGTDFARWPEEKKRGNDQAQENANAAGAATGAHEGADASGTAGPSPANGGSMAQVKMAMSARTYSTTAPRQGQSLRAYNAAMKKAQAANGSASGTAAPTSFEAGPQDFILGSTSAGQNASRSSSIDGGFRGSPNGAAAPSAHAAPVSGTLDGEYRGPVSIASLRAAKSKRDAAAAVAFPASVDTTSAPEYSTSGSTSGPSEALSAAAVAATTSSGLTHETHSNRLNTRPTERNMPTSLTPGSPSATSDSTSSGGLLVGRLGEDGAGGAAPMIDFELPSESFFSMASPNGRSLQPSQDDTLDTSPETDADKALPPTPKTPVSGRQSHHQQQQQQQSPSKAAEEASSSQESLKLNPLSHGVSDTASDTSHESAKGTPDRGRALPQKPMRSPERPAASALTLKPGTLARLESSDSRATTTNEAVMLQPASAATAAASVPPGANLAMYVPPGALSRTRKRKTHPADQHGIIHNASAVRNNSRFSGSTTGSFSTPIRPGFDMPSNIDEEGEEEEEDEYEDEEEEEDEIWENDHSALSMQGSVLPSSAWTEVEDALLQFQDSTAAGIDKGTLLRTVLLPFLQLEVERPYVAPDSDSSFSDARSRRGLFFEWIGRLLIELQHVQTSADRGAILESIAFILESRNLSPKFLQEDLQDSQRFNSVFGHILTYAIGELNKKGVYQNTLIFSGRLLAIAFFRLEGVASKLLRALPVNRFALERIAAEASWEEMQPRDFVKFKSVFPKHLRSHCFQDVRTYLVQLDSLGTERVSEDDDRYLVRQDEVEVEMSGNWLRRWQSDDSELFFSFCRNYHRQLAAMMYSMRYKNKFFGAPGYAHLATCIHQKCVSLVHREILSVTTLSSQKNFNPGETANVLSGSTAGKPRHLEAANRRCTAIVVDVVRAPGINNSVFMPMIQTHIKCLIKRTSLYDVQGVFCLLDWLDSVFTQVEAAELQVEDVLDVSFIIDMVALLLENADHALALMRTIAFCYANFGLLISSKRNRSRFCEEILLKPTVFHKLFLSWSFTIRAYFLHLLVFRLGHVTDFAPPNDDIKNSTAVSIARLFSQRLDEIRKRHDELSPSDRQSSSDDEADDERGLRRRTSFVSTIRRTPSIHRAELNPTAKAERVLGIGLPDPAITATRGENKASSRAAKWLRALGGKGGKGKPTPVKPSTPDSRYSVLTVSPGEQRSGSLSAMLEESDDSGDDSPDEVTLPRTASSQDTSSETPSVASPITSDHIATDAAFDLQSPTAASPHPSTLSSRRSASPRVSRAFSKRSSLVPGPALELVVDDDQPPVPRLPEHLRPRGYDKSRHVYAVQSLREYEQTVQEHDDFMNSQPEGERTAVPRLPVNWPAMWQGD